MLSAPYSVETVRNGEEVASQGGFASKIRNRFSIRAYSMVIGVAAELLQSFNLENAVLDPLDEREKTSAAAP